MNRIFHRSWGRAIRVGCSVLVVMMVVLPGFSSVREPAVAGSFYPASPDSLQRQVRELLSDVEGRTTGPIRALVVPHAGYVYSGAVAAGAFGLIGDQKVSRVIVLGPSHRASFSGGALPKKGVTAFRTPLGDVKLDLDALAKLRRQSYFGGPASAHDGEHCLEVELPFVQATVGEAALVPVLVGYSTDREVLRSMAKSLAELLDDETLVVVSTDFTHHGEAYRYAPFPNDGKLGDRLLELARSTGDLVAMGDGDGFWHQVETSGDTVCGRRPLTVLLDLLEHGFDGRGRLVDVTTSGHVSGDFRQSVSYVSVVFVGQWKAWSEAAPPADLPELSQAQKTAITSLARAVFMTHLKHGPEVAQWFARYGGDPVLQAPAGAFVTLHHADMKPSAPGRLRACMGVIDARQPLVDAVVSAGVSAAHDPRFPTLEASEMPSLEVEVSILSPRTKVPGPESVTIGKHGVVLTKSGRSAVFLPQVAPEQGWDRETMFDHLARKARLPQDAWRRGATIEVFTAQVFGEHEGDHR